MRLSDADKVIIKLAEYEQLDEQRKLLKIPCKFNINPFCNMREVWNAYLEGDYTKAYKNLTSERLK